MHEPVHPPRLKSGDMLGNRYRIISVIGRGGMSTVYLAEDMRLPGKLRAVKEARRQSGACASLAEANMLVGLNHPNLPDIVDYFGAEQEGGFTYLVMDYIEGETLLQRFDRQGRRMPGMQVAGYALQLCDVLDYLHGHRQDPIIYRDLKPSNLMIDMQERLWLIDFGIARRYRSGQDADTVSIGTVGFAAPEQFDGRQTDARTDLYGLGALMYFLLSGGQYRHAASKHLRELDDELPEGLAELVERLLQAEPDDRCQSAAEVRGELQRLLGGDSPAKPPLVVAVGALYAGAGATFTALAIARALHGLGVPHALAEPPKRQPELYALLFGEKHAPPGYRCYNDAAGEAAQREPTAWADGCTLWLPAASSPASAPPEAAAWSHSRWLRRLLELERPLVLVDIGDEWERPDIRELLGIAEQIVYVVDPMLHKLELSATRSRLQLLRGLKEAGKRVHAIANKTVASGHTGQWLNVLPEAPACLLPALDATKVAEASWFGQLVQERPGIQQQLARIVYPWLRSWLPPAVCANDADGAKRTMRKLWKNG